MALFDNIFNLIGQGREVVNAANSGAFASVGGPSGPGGLNLQALLQGSQDPTPADIFSQFMDVPGMSPELALRAVLGFNPGGGGGGAAGDPYAGQKMQLMLEQFGLEKQRFGLELDQFGLAQMTQAAQAAYQRGQLALAEGNLELAQQEFLRGDEIQQAAMSVQAFNAQEGAVEGRGSLEANSANTLANLTNTIGNLANEQARLGLDILSTPRNAIAGFLLGQGATNPNMGAFNPAQILGIDPSQIQSLLQQSLEAVAMTQQRAQDPNQFDLASVLERLSQSANDIALRNPNVAAGAQADIEALNFQRPPSNAQAAAQSAVQSAMPTMGGGMGGPVGTNVGQLTPKPVQPAFSDNGASFLRMFQAPTQPVQPAFSDNGASFLRMFQSGMQPGTGYAGGYGVADTGPGYSTGGGGGGGFNLGDFFGFLAEQAGNRVGDLRQSARTDSRGYRGQR